MKCPACDNLLTKVTIDTVEVDVCKEGCAGIWFDRDELFKLDDSSEAAGNQIFDLQPKISVQNKSQKNCPHCANEILVKQFLDAQNSVQIDQCWSCSGVWMDHGELQKIRSQYSSPEARTDAANQAAHSALSELQGALKKSFQAENPREAEAEQKNKRAAWFVGKFLGIKELLDDYRKG